MFILEAAVYDLHLIRVTSTHRLHSCGNMIFLKHWFYLDSLTDQICIFKNDHLKRLNNFIIDMRYSVTVDATVIKFSVFNLRQVN